MPPECFSRHFGIILWAAGSNIESGVDWPPWYVTVASEVHKKWGGHSQYGNKSGAAQQPHWP